MVKLASTYIAIGAYGRVVWVRDSSSKCLGFDSHCQSCVEVLGKISVHAAPDHPAVMSTWWNEKWIVWMTNNCSLSRTIMQRCILPRETIQVWVPVPGEVDVKSSEHQSLMIEDYKYSHFHLICLQHVVLSWVVSITIRCIMWWNVKISFDAIQRSRCLHVSLGEDNDLFLSKQRVIHLKNAVQ